MSKWYVSVGMSLSIDYDGIIAETKEEAIEIAVKHWKTLIITIVIVILAIQ